MLQQNAQQNSLGRKGLICCTVQGKVYHGRYIKQARGEAAGHVAYRRQREMDACAQVAFCFTPPGLQTMKWHCPQ